MKLVAHLAKNCGLLDFPECLTHGIADCMSTQLARNRGNAIMTVCLPYIPFFTNLRKRSPEKSKLSIVSKFAVRGRVDGILDLITFDA